MSKVSSRIVAHSEARGLIAGWVLALSVAAVSGAILLSRGTDRTAIESPRWHHLPAPEAADPSDALGDRDLPDIGAPPSDGNLVVSGPTALPPTRS
jgi:hypothetical protein